MKLDALKDFLVDPFNNLVDKLDKNPTFNTCHIATGVTGQGKTFAVTSNHIEKLLIDKNQQLVIYSVPLSEIREDEKFEECVDNLMKKSRDDVKFTSYPKIAIKYLRKGKKVVFCTNHQGIWTKVSKYGNQLFNYIYNNKVKVAVFIDEAHTWTISHTDNQKLVSGNSASKYEASLFNKVSLLAEYSPYIFGITATLNREHTDIISTIGNMKFEIYNEMVPKKLMVWKNAWANSFNHFDTNCENSVKENMKKMFSKMIKDENKTGVKKVAIIQCKPKRAKHLSPIDFHADSDTVIEICKELNQNYSFFSTKDNVFSVMTQNSCYSFSSDGMYKTDFDNEEDFKDTANDVDDPLRVIIVVEKGKAGMNIFPLKFVMSLRDYNNKTDEIGEITEFPIQLLGRTVRLYAGKNEDDFKNISPDYDMKEFLNKTKTSIDNIKVMNSCDYYIPNTSVWYAAEKTFQESYITHVDDVNFDDVRVNIGHECEQEVCTRCGGTGVEPKKNIVYNINDKSLSDILQINC